jgi:hypothetical protein
MTESLRAAVRADRGREALNLQSAIAGQSAINHH